MQIKSYFEKSENVGLPNSKTSVQNTTHINIRNFHFTFFTTKENEND